MSGPRAKRRDRPFDVASVAALIETWRKRADNAKQARANAPNAFDDGVRYAEWLTYANAANELENRLKQED